MTSQDRGGAARDVNSLIETILRNKGLHDTLQRYRAWLFWDEVVGPQIASHARPLRLRDSVLEVRVDQAAWMQQLQLLKPMIVQKLNARLGASNIRDLYLKRGTIPAPPPPDEPVRPLPPLTESDRAYVDQILAPLNDDELRRRLAGLIRRDLQERKRHT